jgi:hypothetical protein
VAPPSIDLERGLKSLKWFLETECDFNEQLRNFILGLAHFVPTHCYVACPEFGTYIFHQVICTAMGTCFSVVLVTPRAHARIDTDVCKYCVIFKLGRKGGPQDWSCPRTPSRMDVAASSSTRR